MRRSLLLSLPAFLFAVPAHAAATRVRAGENLQAAIDAARPGDEIRLQAGATFSGNFVLPVFDGTTPITLRTDLPDAGLPGATQRISPTTAAGLARLASPNASAALRTAPGSHHWRVAYIEFSNNKDGYGDILQIGDGSAAQAQVSQVPFEIVLDHLYVHGDRLLGQKRGIALNGRLITIRNCYISDIKAVGADAQAIAGWNGPGPFSIENNYMEASGEVFLLGGADPSIPGLVSEDVSVRSNLLTRPMSWRDPILAVPRSIAAVETAGGALAPGSYAYRVAARRPGGSGNTATSAASPEVAVTTAAGGSVRLTWDAVADASDYVVYGRTPGGAGQYWVTAATQFVDTGAAGRAGAAPAEGTVWQVKNLLELKNARRVRIDANVIENNWQAAQAGYAILFTPRNQDGACTWCVVEAVEFTRNIVRNVAAAVSILGHDSPNVSQQTNTIRLQNNVFYGVSTAFGGNGWGMLIGDGPRDVVIDHNTFAFDGTTLLYAWGAPSIAGFQFTNNASPHGTYGINGAGTSTGTLTLQTFFPASAVTGNWLSGGSAARYPAGNRFETPFVLDLTAASAPRITGTDGRPVGGDMAQLRPLLDSILIGAMTTSPQAPTGLRITSRGK